MRKGALALLLALWLVSVPAWAQDTASIVGTVTDPTGSVVPNAKVTVQNPQKGFVRELTTNGVGAFAVAPVPLGEFTVTAEASGFKKSTRTGITLTAGQIQRVDFTLEVGTTTQEVSVIGNVPHVQTETGAISSLIGGQQVQNLDLNGRNFTALAVLVPGAAMDNGFDSTDVGVYANTSISFNGNREEYNNWMVDGGVNDDETSNSTTNTFPTIDSIAEFRISTATYSADLGRHAGADIQVVTKSGTKDFHGTAYDYVRNDHFDANDFFANRTIAPPGGNAPKTPLIWNNFGYTLGGPLYIPNHYNTDKSKTFFFWDEEWRRIREGSVISANTPSARERTGDFSECDPSSPNYNSIVASGCVLPTVGGQKVDTVAINPNGAALLNGLVPLPNNGVIGYLAAPSVPTNWREDAIRIDENISEKTWVFGRYAQDTWDTTVTPTLWTGATYGTSATQFAAPNKSAVIHLVHTFRPNLVSEFITSFTHDDWTLKEIAGAASPAHSIDRPSTWTVPTLFPGNSGNPLLPAVSVSGGNPFSFSQNEFENSFAKIPYITVQENINWNLGRHTVKFGMYGQNNNFAGQARCNSQGNMSFGVSNPITTGNALADMYLGQIGSYTECSTTVNGIPIGGMQYRSYRQYSIEPFFQDDWKVNKKLTLNLGVRYSLFTNLSMTAATGSYAFEPNLYNPAVEAPLNFSGVLVPNAATGQIYDPNVAGNGIVRCGTDGFSLACTNGTHHNIGPRFGFAYDPTGSGKTVVRGGYGLFYEIGDFNESMAGLPLWTTGPSTLSPILDNLVGYSAITPVSATTIQTEPTGTASEGTIPTLWKFPVVQNFSLGVQHDFGGNNLLTVSYVGSLGRHLATQRNINQVPNGATTMTVPGLAGTGIAGCTSAGVCNVQQVLINAEEPNIFFVPYEGYGTITMQQDTAVSNYNSLQVEYRHTFTHGLTMQSAYTWAHSLDNSSDGGYQSGIDDSNLYRWYGTSTFNRTQMWVTNFVYDLPFFRHSSNPYAREILGGWSISDITSFLSGPPMSINCGINGMSSAIGESISCNSLGTLGVNKSVINDPQFGPTQGWFNPANLGQPFVSQLASNGEPGMFGYTGRDILRGPGRNNWDMALLKNFQAPWFSGEHSTVQFRLETFNTFNHPQWIGINASCSGATTPGTPCNGPNNIGNGEVSSAWSPRILQLALKFLF
jgi:hypothetical protein